MMDSFQFATLSTMDVLPTALVEQVVQFIACLLIGATILRPRLGPPEVEPAPHRGLRWTVAIVASMVVLGAAAARLQHQPDSLPHAQPVLAAKPTIDELPQDPGPLANPPRELAEFLAHPRDVSLADVLGRTELGAAHAFLGRVTAGGVLVGLRVSCRGDFWDELVGIQPIFQVRDRYQLGHWWGDELGRVFQSLARPGYIVGGVCAAGVRRLQGVQLIFYPAEDGQISSWDAAYRGQWLGSEGSPGQTLNMATPVVALAGSKGEVGLESLAISSLNTGLQRFRSGPDVALGEILAKTPLEEQWVSAEVAPFGKPYRDQAAPGALMVGIRLEVDHETVPRVSSMQPIYQRGGNYQLGAAPSPEAAGALVYLANPGYAVGGVRWSSGGRGIQLVFMRVLAGYLNPDDAYASAWIGRQVGEVEEWLSDGRPVVGWNYRDREGHLADVSLLLPTDARYANPRRQLELLAAEASAPSEPASSDSWRVRIWTSTRGQRVKAEFIHFDSRRQQLTVRRSVDGKRLTVSTSRLCDADRQFLRRHADAADRS